MIVVFMDQEVSEDYAVIWDGKNRFDLCQLWPTGQSFHGELGIDQENPKQSVTVEMELDANAAQQAAMDMLHFWETGARGPRPKLNKD